MSDLGSIKTGVGLGGGIPIQELVEQSVNQQFEPKRERIGAQELEFQAKITSLGKLQSKLSELQTAARNISKPNTLLGKAANVANNPSLANPTATYLKATASENARVGTYDIKVNQLALSDKYTSQPASLYADETIVIGTGTLNMTLGFGQSTSKTFQISIDNQNGNNTLGGICRNINAQSSVTGISASLIKSDLGYLLSIGSNLSGAPSTLKITVSNNGGDGLGLNALSTDNLHHAVTAQDAKIEVDGVPITLYSNHAVDVIAGVTLDLYQPTQTAGAVFVANTVQISNDSSQTLEKIKNFVEKYNSVIDFMGKVTKRKDDKNNAYSKSIDEDDSKDSSKTSKKDKEEDKKRDYTINQKTGNGIFIGDVTMLTLRSALSQALGTRVNQAAYDSIAQLGILSEKDSKTGKLAINEDTLKRAIDTNATNVVNLFTANTASGAYSDGIGVAFDKLMDTYVSIPKGKMLKASLNLTDKLRNIAIERLKIDKDASQLEYTLTKKYANLDRALAKQKNAENSLMQSFAAMDNSSKR